ncbi:MAG: GH36-type glycosyl hydrolase domain-containing protein [Fimbriimonadales bacterium]
MRLPRWGRPRTLVVGFYQSAKSVRPVVADLRSRRLFRSATAHVSAEGRSTVGSWVTAKRLGIIVAAACGILAAVFVRLASARVAPYEMWLHVFIAAATGTAGGWAIARLADLASAKAFLNRYSRWALRGESLVLVAARTDDAAAAAEILSESGGEHPAVFVLHPPEIHGLLDHVMRVQPALGEDAINMRAAKLAAELRNVRRGRPPERSLIPRLDLCERALKEIQLRLSSAVRLEQGIALSAEWLLDNAYIVQGHMEDFRHNLPAGFYRELPFVTSGPFSGFPRVYAVASELVADWDAHLTRQSIQSFLQTFQSETTLTTGELWALPMMLRLRLIEYLTSLSIEVERRQSESDQAAFWANRLLYTARREPDRIPEVLAAIAVACPRPSSHMVEELLSQLYDEEAALTPVRAWLQTKFPAPLEDVVRQDEQQETADQVSLANAISTLRLLAQVDWRDLFEAVSHVEATLWTDPALVYGRMDFATRDRYRHVVEELSRRGRLTEETVAQIAIELAVAATDEPTRHVGYYLVDDGRPALERRLHVRTSVRHLARRWIRRHAALVYIGGIAGSAACAVLLALFFSHVSAMSTPVLAVLAALFVLPAVELSVQLVNYVVTRVLEPRPLPKMSFEDGIPDECRTLVVVPMMLLTPNSIREEVERLEIRALANPDRNLRFALLGDYSDAPNQHMPEDLELLDVAVRRIEELNQKHGSDTFLLFYRERKWCDSEQCWMGWERKRGKLEDLNGYLVGDSGAEDDLRLGAGIREAVSGIRFVITLDSDTQLPRDTASRLVATLAHPLNTPHLSPDARRVVRGYTIIQPRVSTSLPSATTSLFTRLFTDPTGMDPYTHAVSDVYQDLSDSGSYHGKGIYDVAMFHRMLGGRFPSSHLLSHDLIEGAHVRVGLATDIELLDLFPPDYSVYSARLHRWTRGDWQIADWLLPSVPSGTGKREPNPLPALERWKILDNLRRSITPAGIVSLLVIGCALSPKPDIGALLVCILILAPMLFHLVSRVTQPWKIDPLAWREPVLNLMRSALLAAVLPHQAYLCLNAAVRVWYRRVVSHRLLLEWATSSHAARSVTPARRVLLEMAWVPVFAALVVAGVVFLQPRAAAAIAPFGVLWACSPFLIAWLDTPLVPKTAKGLPVADRQALRHIARQTWRYFDDFVGPETHWLPPDNYQEMLRVELAERTSPTNIGLYLLSVLAAHDFGYLPPDRSIERVGATLLTLTNLERYRGHLLNWYDTKTLEPLGERYVSTVDSSNLMGCLWTLQQGLQELLDAPVFGPPVFRGLSDTFALLCQVIEKSDPPVVAGSEILAVGKLLATHPDHIADMVGRLRELTQPVDELMAAVMRNPRAPQPCEYWARQLQREVAAWNAAVKRYLSWVDVIASPPEEGILGLGPRAHGLRRQALAAVPSLRSLATGAVPGLSDLLALHAQDSSKTISEDLRTWLDRIADEAARAQAGGREAVDQADVAQTTIRKLDSEMEMSFLFDPERRLFAIGYNVADQRLDRSYYDLLASEARLGSFLAIARGDVPTEHWWALGRPFGFAYFRRPLLSWNGTMFEYLMPLLLTRSYENSLLDQACHTALDCQIAYARSRGIPWGISEAAYSALDSRQIYQYRAFGVPALALKRGLEEDFVVSPYSSALALAIDPKAAVRNLRSPALHRLGARGEYGFYESIDYTRQHGPRGERGLVVYTFMAHHQGMILLAIDNAVGQDPMQRRFHADPRVQATVSLLFERIPVAPPLVKNYPRETPVTRLAPIVAVSELGRIDTPHTPTPRTCLLSNGAYRAMITNAGGGYSRWRELDITRWRADTTADDQGKFCYLKDLDSGFVWSTAHHPVGARTQSYQAIFSAEKAEFRRRDRGIETITEIVISPEDNAEVWRITLINRTMKARRIELTSYAELALAPHAADRTHPAFNKLFIETAVLRDLDALLAWRRPRSPDDAPVWAAHVISTERRMHEPAQFETDRARFIGRGRRSQNPRGIEEELSGSAGYVLDPIFSLRRKVTIGPGERLQVAFVTMAGDSRDEVHALCVKYSDLEAVQRAFHLAWTQAQLELRHLRIKPGEAHLYQQLASHVLYPHAHLRAPADRLARNTLGQSRLWAYGISGDLPMVVVTIDEAQHIDLVQEVLAAHNFWRSRGLVCDLVILNEEAASYEQPLEIELQRLVAARSQNTGVDQPGGVFLRPAAKIAPEDMTLLLSAAHVVLVAARGTLSQQIGVPASVPVRPLAKRERPISLEEPSPPLPFMELKHFNGVGGFSGDGREYAIYLEQGRTTPRPWSNVIANPQFGTLVTDEGTGFTWAGNSQSNRLTAWSNDPICNPAGDAIYIYDKDLDTLWSPTPKPIREDDPYRSRHGQGYTVHEHNSHAIEQELTTFVPADESGRDSVRVQRLRLTNRSSRRRSLTVTFYVEWLLGADREDSQLHVVTNWDLETQSIFARNPFSPSYSTSVAYASCNRTPLSFTADRTEVLGRNGSLSDPAALRQIGLSGRIGGGLDPCAALQIQVDLEPGDQSEVVFLLGQAPDAAAARDTIRRFRRQKEVDQGLETTREFWDRLLGTVNVETPDPAIDTLFNRWLLYQTLSCRVWGRSAFYQSGGAFGFRDQLQDVLALVYAQPELARAHILRSAARQFPEGDVQHWWHPQTGAGVRSRNSDDLLWLPFVVAQYVRVTGDKAILDESVPFIEGRLLDKGEHDAYLVPTESAQAESLLEHCRRAVEKGATSGAHGLPKIGSGDWNDGLNLVGVGGKGESVWLAWFLIHVFRDLAELLDGHGDAKSAKGYLERSLKLAATVEATAWDGEWYRRAYFDDGSPLGSREDLEAQIDSLPQSWAVISGAGAPDRAQTAMESVSSKLVREADRLVLLFSPPFDRTPLQPGYIKGYPPGVRENGGQYTHGALWVAMAWARLGNGAEAVRLLQLMNPINLASTEEDVSRYKVEPYAVAADVYALEGRIGMGGWTWYSGSSAWMYRVWLEEVFGFCLRGNALTIAPAIPPDWPGFKVRYRFGRATYAFEISNPKHVSAGIESVELDGNTVPSGSIALVDDESEHHVRVLMGPATGRSPVSGRLRGRAELPSNCQ